MFETKSINNVETLLHCYTFHLYWTIQNSVEKKGVKEKAVLYIFRLLVARIYNTAHAVHVVGHCGKMIILLLCLISIYKNGKEEEINFQTVAASHHSLQGVDWAGWATNTSLIGIHPYVATYNDTINNKNELHTSLYKCIVHSLGFNVLLKHPTIIQLSFTDNFCSQICETSFSCKIQCFFIYSQWPLVVLTGQ